MTRYAVMDVDRGSLLTAGSTITREDGGAELVIAEEGQTLFSDREGAVQFLREHYDSNGFGPELEVVTVERTPNDEDYPDPQ